MARACSTSLYNDKTFNTCEDARPYQNPEFTGSADLPSTASRQTTKSHKKRTAETAILFLQGYKNWALAKVHESIVIGIIKTG